VKGKGAKAGTEPAKAPVLVAPPGVAVAKAPETALPDTAGAGESGVTALIINKPQATAGAPARAGPAKEQDGKSAADQTKVPAPTATPSTPVEPKDPAPARREIADKRRVASSPPSGADSELMSWGAATTVTRRDGTAVALLEEPRGATTPFQRSAPPASGLSPAKDGGTGTAQAAKPAAGPRAAEPDRGEPGRKTSSATPSTDREAETTVAQSPSGSASQSAITIATGSLREGTLPRPLERFPLPILMIGIAAVGSLLASTYFLLARRSERLHTATVLGRDLASVSWERDTAARAVPGEGGSQAGAGDKGPVLDPGSAKKQDTPEPAAPSLGPPSLAEAYELVGANPKTPLESVKRLVDSLRQSWLPDLASSEEDRRYHEQRIRQIDAAWDVISAARKSAG
jgi:hypothetical protein